MWALQSKAQERQLKVSQVLPPFVHEVDRLKHPEAPTRFLLVALATAATSCAFGGNSSRKEQRKCDSGKCYHF